MLIFTSSKLFNMSIFWEKSGLLPTAGAENHVFRGFTVATLMQAKFKEMQQTGKAPEPVAK